MAALV
jgi:hypothetical protein